METKLERMYQAAAHLNVLLGREVLSIEFNQGNAQESYVAALYASTLELTGDALILIKENRHSGVPIIIRSALEAHMQMRALVADAEYYKRMLAKYYREDAKIRTAALKLDQSDASPETIEKMRTKRDQSRKNYDQLKDEGHLPCKILETFQCADRASWYGSIYALLCSHTHSNLREVTGRHFEVEGGKVFPVFERVWADNEIICLLEDLGRIMIDAHHTIVDFFKVEETDAVRTAADEHEKAMGGE